MEKLMRDQDYGMSDKARSERIVHLIGSPSSEKAMIEEAIRSDKNPIFVLQGAPEKGAVLATYIDQLHDEGMSNKLIHRFKVCREISFENHVTLFGQREYQPKNMTELLDVILEEKATIIIENNSRTLLADILQQLIYIEYPTDKIDIKLRKEFKDAEKSRRFMQNIEPLLENLTNARKQLEDYTIEEDNEQERQELYEIIADTKCSYLKIKEQLDKAKNMEMKIAMAATKKTGKSVLANSMIGMELAPTSLEMATPNNCIYKKSKDHLFRLEYRVQSGEMKRIEKEKRSEIHSYIFDAFKRAQQDAENKYTLSDMEIQYVSNKNNFESYTIYDTPGPDLAGADHLESAERAIKACDVALFAIDYSKYLTKDEESFLKEVRRIFQNNQKYHTLMFTINKIDMALQDKGTQSRIKSIDFIRNRIIELGDAYQTGESGYRDCVIFATSSIDYFYTLELEDAVREGRIDKEILSSEKLYRLAYDYADEYEEDDSKADLTALLSNIGSEASKLKNILGNKKVSVETIKEYSGMPQLLSYISYITKSKAREEIVNSITYIIDREMREIQRIRDKISNIEKLITFNEEKKQRIKKIIDDYSKATQEIMSDDIIFDEVKALNRNDYTGLLSYIEKYEREYPESEALELKRLGDVILKDKSTPYWADVEASIVMRIRSAVRKEIERLKEDAIQKKVKGIGTGKFGIPHEKIQKIIEEKFNEIREEKLNPAKKILEECIEGFEKVLNNRIEQLKVHSATCKTELDKEDCVLALPALPEFDISFGNESMALPPIDCSKLKIDMSVAFDQFGGFTQFWRNFIFINSTENSDWMDYKEVKVKSITDDTINQALDKLQKNIENYLKKEVRLSLVLDELIDTTYGSIKEKWKQVDTNFDNANKNIRKGADDFRTLVDDSEKYTEKNTLLNRKKKMINDIMEYSKDFLSVWDKIVGV